MIAAESSKVTELKSRLKARGLSTSGKKVVLQARLKEALQAPVSTPAATSSVSIPTSGSSPSVVVSIPDTNSVTSRSSPTPAPTPNAASLVLPSSAASPLRPAPSMTTWDSEQVRQWLASLALKPEWDVSAAVTEGKTFAEYTAIDLGAKIRNQCLGKFVWRAKEKKLGRSIDMDEYYFASLPLATIRDNLLLIPNDVAENDTIFVRDCWEKFVTLIKDGWDKKCNALVTGTPGIGKSTFLFYFMWVLLHDQQGTARFVLDTGSENNRLFLDYTNGLLVHIERGNCLEQICTRQVYYLVDGCLPHSPSSLTLEVSSPKKSRWGTFAKNANVIHRVMPSWSFVELQTAASCLNSPMGASLADRYEWLGGTYRFVLTHGHRNPEDIVQKAIQRIKLEDFIHRNGDIETDELSSELIHLHPSTDDAEHFYDSVFFDFASPKVARRVRESLKAEVREHYARLVALSGTNIYFSGLRGRVFEDMAQEALVNGGQFSVRLLTPPLAEEGDGHRRKRQKQQEPTTLILPPARVQALYSAEEIKSLPDGFHGKPTSPHFPSFDCFRQPGMLFQMMTALRHGFKLSGVRSVLPFMRSKAPKIYCVVPENILPQIQWQLYIEKGKGVAIPDDLAGVEQWVLGIPVDSK